MTLLSQREPVEYQSSFERDFVIMCDFAPEVEMIRWQPFTLGLWQKLEQVALVLIADLAAGYVKYHERRAPPRGELAYNVARYDSLAEPDLVSDEEPP